MLESNIIAVSPAAFSQIAEAALSQVANQAGPAVIETTLQASPGILSQAAGAAGTALKSTPGILAKIGSPQGRGQAIFAGAFIVIGGATLAYKASRWAAPHVKRKAISACDWARSKMASDNAAPKAERVANPKMHWKNASGFAAE